MKCAHIISAQHTNANPHSLQCCGLLKAEINSFSSYIYICICILLNNEKKRERLPTSSFTLDELTYVIKYIYIKNEKKKKLKIHYFIHLVQIYTTISNDNVGQKTKKKK